MGPQRDGWWIVGWLLFLASPLNAMTRVFLSSQESVEREMVRLIDQSRSSIDLAVFRFSSRPLALAVSRARSRHVRLRIVLDGRSEAEGKDDNLGIAFVRGEVRRLDGKRNGTQGIMHHKFVLFDRARVVTGSFNWTSGAEHVNYENALLTDASSAVSAFGREFERLWERSDVVDLTAGGGGWSHRRSFKIPSARADTASKSAKSKAKAKPHARKKKHRKAPA